MHISKPVFEQIWVSFMLSKNFNTWTHFTLYYKINPVSWYYEIKCNKSAKVCDLVNKKKKK